MRCTIIAPISYGIMLSLIAGGIDLSSGSLVGLVGIAFVLSIQSNFAIGISVLICILLGLVIGLINALLIAKANANPFVVTLSTMFVGQSIERLSTQGGLPIYLYNTSTNFTNFTNIYRGEIIGIPNPILIFIILTIVYYIFLNKTTYGRKFYASGTGIKAARIVGIKVRLYHGLAYLFSALSCVVAGIILASKINSGQPLVGEVYLWDAIGAGYLSTLISKTHRANIFGTVLGILFFGIVSNGLTLIGVEFYWKEFFKGILIMLILLFSAMQKRYQTV